MTTPSSHAISIRANPMKNDEEIVVGKDILELLTSAMYVDPLSIYREYVQNAADAIEEGVAVGLYQNENLPRIDVKVDLVKRAIIIRDNGIGIENQEFAKRLTALGASHKRGTKQRGFRGVGRLSGLGYCQQLVFRSKSRGDQKVLEIVWDGRRLKEMLRDISHQDRVEDVIKNITEIGSLPSTGWPDHFFEVELRQVVRFKNDLLLNAQEINQYLAQTGPVPFSPDFVYGNEIMSYLQRFGGNSTFNVYLNDSSEPIYRPHRDEFQVKEDVSDSFNEIAFVEVPGVEGDVDAVICLLHHSYYGAIPKRAGVSGLRVRAGNIQVGSDRIFIDAFPEPRFNSWCVGEIYVLNRKIAPNGRRDDFEQNVHYLNLQGHIATLARDVARIARAKSSERNRQKLAEAQSNIEPMDEVLEHLANIAPPEKKDTYLEVMSAFYECAPNKVEAQKLIRKIIDKLAKAPTTPSMLSH